MIVLSSSGISRVIAVECALQTRVDASCVGLDSICMHREGGGGWLILSHAKWCPRGYSRLSGFCVLTNSSARRSKISSWVFFPSPHTQVASPAAGSRDAIVIVGPVPLFNCTTSPSLNSCMGRLLCVCDEVYRLNSTQSHSQRVT